MASYRALKSAMPRLVRFWKRMRAMLAFEPMSLIQGARTRQRELCLACSLSIRTTFLWPERWLREDRIFWKIILGATMPQPFADSKKPVPCSWDGRIWTNLAVDHPPSRARLG